MQEGKPFCRGRAGDSRARFSRWGARFGIMGALSHLTWLACVACGIPHPPCPRPSTKLIIFLLPAVTGRSRSSGLPQDLVDDMLSKARPPQGRARRPDELADGVPCTPTADD